MNKKELPIRTKVEIAQRIGKIIQCLHNGGNPSLSHLIEDLKARAVHLDPQIQQDILIFAEQVQFQYSYDEWHKMTPEIQEAADKLIDDLGFQHPLE